MVSLRGFGIMGSDLRECERAVDGCIPLIPRLKKTPLGRARHRQRHCDGNEERWTEVLKLFSPLGIFGGAWRLRRWMFVWFASEGLGLFLFGYSPVSNPLELLGLLHEMGDISLSML